jgi:hypothetical protein
METIIERNIYKVNNIVDGKTKSIYIFNTSKNNNKPEDIFSKTKLAEIKNNNITLIFSSQQIHMDDTIGIIKLKLINELKNVSFDEIYLFCKKSESLNSENIYQILTKHKKVEITNSRLTAFLSNVEGIEPISPKDIYDYSDIIQLNANNKPHIISKPLGQNKIINDNETLIPTNPFQIVSNDLFVKIPTNLISNNKLLLNSGTIIDNDIYLCLAKNTMEFIQQKSLNQPNIIKAYFPLLFDKNIHNLEQLSTNQTNLISENNKLLNQHTFDYFKTVDMFYNIYYQRKKELNYLSKGIK